MQALHDARRLRPVRFGRGLEAFKAISDGLLPMEALLGCRGGPSRAGGDGTTCWANRRADEEVARGNSRLGGAEGFAAGAAVEAPSAVLKRIASKSETPDEPACASRSADEEVPCGRMRAGASAVRPAE